MEEIKAESEARKTFPGKDDASLLHALDWICGFSRGEGGKVSGRIDLSINGMTRATAAAVNPPRNSLVLDKLNMMLRT